MRARTLRNKAMNMASVWCRCGQSWRVSGKRPGGVMGPPAAARAASSSVDVVPSRRGRPSTTPAVSASTGRAGGVEDHSPGPDAVERRARAARCWSGTRSRRSSGVRRQRDSGRRRSAPSPEQGASTRTRSKVSAGQARSGPVGRDHPAARRRRRRAPAGTRRARCGCRSAASSPAPAARRERGQQGRLAARAGAQVQPALVPSLDRRPAPARGRPAGSPRPGRRPGPRRRRGRRRGRRPPGPRRTARSGCGCRAARRRSAGPGRATRTTRGGSLSAASRASSSS